MKAAALAAASAIARAASSDAMSRLAGCRPRAVLPLGAPACWRLPVIGGWLRLQLPAAVAWAKAIFGERFGASCASRAGAAACSTILPNSECACSCLVSKSAVITHPFECVLATMPRGCELWMRFGYSLQSERSYLRGQASANDDRHHAAGHACSAVVASHAFRSLSAGVATHLNSKTSCR